MHTTKKFKIRQKRIQKGTSINYEETQTLTSSYENMQKWVDIYLQIKNKIKKHRDTQRYTCRQKHTDTNTERD